MVEFDDSLAQRAALVDAVDHLLNRGVALVGNTTISLAGVDLIYLELNLLLTSVETMRRQQGGASPPQLHGGTGPDQPPPPVTTLPTPAPAELAATASLHPPLTDLYSASQAGSAVAPSSDQAPTRYTLGGMPERISGDPDARPERGLARLVLTLIELIRQILERQALRRTEGAGLNEDEVERMGIALMELEGKMAELRDAFGLSEEDLSLDLGPLGRLLQ